MFAATRDTQRFGILMLAILMVCSCLLFLSGCSSEEEAVGPQSETDGQAAYMLFFGGGPNGGTFNFFANKIATLISDTHASIQVEAVRSAGSVQNLRNLDAQVVNMTIIYGGDAFLGRKGKLPGDPKRYESIRALAFLYGAPAQLVVRKGIGVDKIMDLVGKRVAIGNPGSGAALSAERLFKHLGLWDKVEVVNLGYSDAATDLVAGTIDAFWVLVGYPNASVIAAAEKTNVTLISVHEEAAASGFYDVYPFYTLTEIPAGTYVGQDKPVVTFEDAALWCVNSALDEQVAYEALCAVYCEEGLKAMVASHKAAREMTVEGGVRGVSIPLHSGAARFWDERSVYVPPSFRP